MNGPKLNARSVGILKHLLAHGACSRQQLLEQFPAVESKVMTEVLCTLTRRRWMARIASASGTYVYAILREAYPRLRAMGVDVGEIPPGPDLRIVHTLPNVAGPRCMPVWGSGTYAPNFSAPARAGAMQFAALPSRGPI